MVDENRVGHEAEAKMPLSYIIFALSPKMASIFSIQVRIFHKFDKTVFSNNYFFLKNYVYGINFL